MPPPGSQWGLAPAVQNPGAGAPIAPTTNSPRPAQFQPAHAAGRYQILSSPKNPQGPIELPLPESGNPGPSGCAEQHMPPLAMHPLKFLLHSCASIFKISGTALGNNPQQMFPQVVVNN